MARRYQIRFNVRGTSFGLGGSESSLSGHINVTLAVSDEDEGRTYGATVLDSASPWGGIWRQAGDTKDGIIRDESDDLRGGKYTWVTRTVPVTEEQYFAIKRRLDGMINKTYDYAIQPGLGEKLQVCSSFASAVYKMTGHPKQVGALFSDMDRARAPGFVWSWIPITISPKVSGGLVPDIRGLSPIMPGSPPPGSVPVYRPKEPVSGHYPEVEDVGLNLHQEELQFGDGHNGQERGFGDVLRTIPWKEMVRSLKSFGPLSSADTPERNTIDPTVRRRPLRDQKAPETILGAAPVEEHQPDEDEFEGDTILTRRKRRKKKEKFAGSGKLAAVSPERVNGSLLFPNSDHN